MKRIDARQAMAGLAIGPDNPDTIILSVRLKSGRFEGSIEVPLFCSKEEREGFIDSWLSMMEAGLKCGSANRDRPLGEAPK